MVFELVYKLMNQIRLVVQTSIITATKEVALAASSSVDDFVVRRGAM